MTDRPPLADMAATDAEIDDPVVEESLAAFCAEMAKSCLDAADLERPVVRSKRA